MAAPLLLLADHYGISTIAFGTTLESSEVTLRSRATSTHLSEFEAAGVGDGTVLRGCNEFLASKIVFQNAPDLVERSLASLAETGSEKAFRKALSIRIARAALNESDVDLENLPLPKMSVRFGGDIFVDFAFLVIAKICGPDRLAQWVDFPPVLVEGIDSVDCAWLFKYHPVGFHGLDGRLRASLEVGLATHRISVFTEDDLESYTRFIDLLDVVRSNL